MFFYILNNNVCSVQCADPGVDRAHNDDLASSSARQPPRAQDQLQALPPEGLHKGQDQVQEIHRKGHTGQAQVQHKAQYIQDKLR